MEIRKIDNYILIFKNDIQIYADEAVKQFIESKRISSRIPQAPVVEPSFAQRRVVESAIEISNSRAKKLGFDKVFTPEEFHFISGETLKSLGLEPDVLGFSTTQGSLIINSDANDLFKTLQTCIHEMRHEIGIQTFTFDKLGAAVKKTQSGFSISDSKDSTYKHFEGLNEAIVEIDTLFDIREHIQRKGIEQTIKDYETTEETLRTSGVSYESFIRVLEIIIGNMNKESPMGELERLRYAQAHKNLFYLRGIERFFGKGSLRVLASLGDTKDLNLANSNAGLISQFFQSDTQEQKDKIAEVVLNDKERVSYWRRRNFRPQKLS